MMATISRSSSSETPRNGRAGMSPQGMGDPLEGLPNAPSCAPDLGAVELDVDGGTGHQSPSV